MRSKELRLGMTGSVACLVASCAWMTACSHSSAGTTADAGAAPSASAAPPSPPPSAAAAPSVVDKALSFLSGGPFEGDITMTITPESRPAFTQVFEVKGERLRMNTPPAANGDHMYVVTDYAAKKIMTISDTKKTATFMNWDDVSGIAAAAKQKMQTGAPVATGRKDIVAGYVCDVYETVSTAGDKNEACIARGLHFPRMGSSGTWLGALEGDDWFPMRVDAMNPIDHKKTHMEVTRVEKKSLPESTFAIPAGYKSQDMEDLLKGLPNAPNAKGGGKGHSHK
jgi:hypothetical protein